MKKTAFFLKNNVCYPNPFALSLSQGLQGFDKLSPCRVNVVMRNKTWGFERPSGLKRR
jgi:hypothetical protein